MAFLPVGAAVAGIAGTAFSGISAWQQGKYQNQVAKNNAAIAETNAGLASDASQIEAMRSDREYAQQLGSILAGQGASGLDVLGRSQLATRDNLRRVGREEAGDIRKEGTADARRLLQDAANFKAEGAAAKASGRNALISSGFDVVSQAASAFGPEGSLVGGARSTKRGKTKAGKYR